MLRSNNDKKKGQTTPLMRTKPRWRKKKKHLVRIIQSAPTHCPNYYNLSYLYHCHSTLTGCIGKGSISLENKTTHHHLHYRPPLPPFLSKIWISLFVEIWVTCFSPCWICSGIANAGNLWLSWKFTRDPPQLAPYTNICIYVNA